MLNKLLVLGESLNAPNSLNDYGPLACIFDTATEPFLLFDMQQGNLSDR